MLLCHLSAPTLARLATVAALALSGNAFANDDGHHHGGDRDDTKTRLKGYMEVPAVSTVATGRFRATIDERSGSISYQITYSGLEGEVRQAHIHFGQKSVNGGIVVFLCQTSANRDPTGLAPDCPQSGTVTGVLQAANVIGPAPPPPPAIPGAGQGIAAMEFDELVAAIRAGVAYVNVHSSKFPGGEIRGQLREND